MAAYNVCVHLKAGHKLSALATMCNFMLAMTKSRVLASSHVTGLPNQLLHPDAGPNLPQTHYDDHPRKIPHIMLCKAHKRVSAQQETLHPVELRPMHAQVIRRHAFHTFTAAQ